MFALNMNHREALLNRLEDIVSEIETNRVHDKKLEKGGVKDQWMRDWGDMKLFLLQEEKKIILKSIKENKIDF